MMEESSRRVCVYGGSFDPVHTGHGIVASYVAQWGGFDEVWLMVSRHNPIKDGRPASETDRLAMAELVAARCPGVRVSDFEMRLPSPSYTYTTLCRLRAAYPDCEFTLLVGADNWVSFDLWRDNDRIVEEFGIVIYPRRGFEVEEETLPPGVSYLSEAPRVEISSTFIRKAISEGRNVEFFLPPDVKEYAEAHNLYKTP